MNLFERIEREYSNERNAIDKIITEYFEGHKVNRSLCTINFDNQILKLKYNIYIDSKLHAIDIEVSYLYSKYVNVDNVVGAFDRTVTGYLEQTIKRELISEE